MSELCRRTRRLMRSSSSRSACVNGSRASPEEVDEVVATYHHGFDGRPIRDFVPILVERKERDRLRTFPRQRN